MTAAAHNSGEPILWDGGYEYGEETDLYKHVGNGEGVSVSSKGGDGTITQMAMVLGVQRDSLAQRM